MCPIMDTFAAIEARRSVKHYDPSHRLTEAEIQRLIQAGMMAPTAFNIQHWRFVVVLDPALRKEIRALAWNQAQVTDASALIILCADRNAWKRNPERYWRNAPAEVQGMLVPAIGGYYEGRESVQRDECLRSCGLAGQNILLAAKAMGYDSCPMDGFDFDGVARLIRLPEDHMIAFMIAVGKGVKGTWPRPGQLDYSEVVIRDRF